MKNNQWYSFNRGTLSWQLFSLSSGTLPYEIKIVIAGNHELTFDQEFMADLIKQDFYYFPSASKLKPENYENVQSMLTNCIYLQDSDVTVRGFRIYGSPWWVSLSLARFLKSSCHHVCHHMLLCCPFPLKSSSFFAPSSLILSISLVNTSFATPPCPAIYLCASVLISVGVCVTCRPWVLCINTDVL